MKNIEFTDDILVGGKKVDAISVAPTSFVALAKMQNEARDEKEFQRRRLLAQTHFMLGKDRLTATTEDLFAMPYSLAAAIRDSMDLTFGPPGELVESGDAISGQALYKLGTPIKMKGGDGDVEITELEFIAGTYGEMEDVLIADTSMLKTVALLGIANPVQLNNMTRLPGWAIDNVTVSDGAAIMSQVLPRF